MQKIAFLQGDEIGPEIAQATKQVLQTASEQFAQGLDSIDITVGFDALKTHGSTFPETVMERVHNTAGIILGPVSHNAYPAPRPRRSEPFRRVTQASGFIREYLPCPYSRRDLTQSRHTA